jgi:hypothetical protein
MDLLGSPLSRYCIVILGFCESWVEVLNPVVFPGLNPTYNKTHNPISLHVRAGVKPATDDTTKFLIPKSSIIPSSYKYILFFGIAVRLFFAGAGKLDCQRQGADPADIHEHNQNEAARILDERRKVGA